MKILRSGHGYLSEVFFIESLIVELLSSFQKRNFEAPLVFSILLTHEGSHREVHQQFQPRYDIFRSSGAKGCLDHRFRAPPAFTAQLLTLH